MNPCGKVLDIHGIQALGEEVNIAPIPKNPEKLFDIVRDLNNQKGRGKYCAFNYQSIVILKLSMLRLHKIHNTNNILCNINIIICDDTCFL